MLLASTGPPENAKSLRLAAPLIPPSTLPMGVSVSRFRISPTVPISSELMRYTTERSKFGSLSLRSATRIFPCASSSSAHRGESKTGESDAAANNPTVNPFRIILILALFRCVGQ